MKRLALVFALVLVLSISAGAQDFGAFSAGVPEGWMAKEDSQVVNFTKNDNSANISIMVNDTKGATAKQLSESFAEECSKKGFTEITTSQADNYGDYIFEMTNPEGVKSRVIISVKGGKFLTIIAAGIDNASDDMTKILTSIKIK